MNKLVMMLVAMMVTLFAVDAMAFDPPAAPASGWYVVDQTGKMSASQIKRLNEKIDTVSKTTKNEFAILLLSDMGGDNIEDVAYTTFKKWGVGKRGLDNGCLIVVSVKERKSRIETGKGVGGEVTDVQASDILKNNLAPHLKKGDFYGGFDDTLGALSSLIESRHAQKAAPVPTTAPVTETQPVTRPQASGGCAIGTPETDSFWPMAFMFGAIGVGVWLLVRRNKRLKREADEAEARMERERAARIALATKQREEEAAFRARRDREAALRLATPVVTVPSVAPRSTVPPATKPAVPRAITKPVEERKTSSAGAAAAAIGAAAAAQALQDKLRREREARESREADERRARDRRDEEDRRRRQREEDDARSSSSSSSSSFDWGGSSGGSDSGGGFGGGDSGGGGASGDW